MENLQSSRASSAGVSKSIDVAEWGIHGSLSDSITTPRSPGLSLGRQQKTGAVDEVDLPQQQMNAAVDNLMHYCNLVNNLLEEVDSAKYKIEKDLRLSIRNDIVNTHRRERRQLCIIHGDRRLKQAITGNALSLVENGSATVDRQDTNTPTPVQEARPSQDKPGNSHNDGRRRKVSAGFVVPVGPEYKRHRVLKPYTPHHLPFKRSDRYRRHRPAPDLKAGQIGRPSGSPVISFLKMSFQLPLSFVESLGAKPPTETAPPPSQLSSGEMPSSSSHKSGLSNEVRIRSSGVPAFHPTAALCGSQSPGSLSPSSSQQPGDSTISEPVRYSEAKHMVARSGEIENLHLHIGGQFGSEAAETPSAPTLAEPTYELVASACSHCTCAQDIDTTLPDPETKALRRRSDPPVLEKAMERRRASDSAAAAPTDKSRDDGIIIERKTASRPQPELLPSKSTDYTNFTTAKSHNIVEDLVAQWTTLTPDTILSSC